MWIKDPSKQLLEHLEKENTRLRGDVLELRKDLREERERNRVREEAILDRVLTRHGSRPVSPAPDVIQVLPFTAKRSDEEEARKRDFIAEEVEQRGLTPKEMTPHLRAELDQMFEEWDKASK
jgi:hypothetical protein